MRKKMSWQVESLETRKLMAADLAVHAETVDVAELQIENDVRPVVTDQIISLNTATGCVEVEGSDALDQVTVEESPILSNPFPQIPLSGGVRLSGIRVTHEDVISGEITTQTFLATDVQKVCFDARGHNDIFYNFTAVPSEVTGGEGDDQLYGGSGDDELRGGDGADIIEGGAGNDTIYGGANAEGPDVLRGNAGSDHIYGGQGDDEIDGGIGHDFLFGDEGNDTIDGGDGNDELYGDSEDSQEGGQDLLIGGEGDDDLYGGPQADRLEGNEGADDLWGEDGPDHILGGQGNDRAWGGQGADTIEGGEDDDELRGQDGPDRLFGGGGIDELFGGAGDDGLWGGALDDLLTGGNGHDRFLIHEIKDADDTVTDETSSDVRVNFENGDRDRHNGVWYESESWLYDEILEVDEALAVMVARTHNNALLRTAGGRELTFIRVGDPEETTGTVAWNADNTGKITISDLAFDDYNAADAVSRESADDFIHHVVIHEVGHNWDDENDDWGEFKDISGWRNNLFTGFQWQFDAGAEGFVTNYASSHPREDFAETFAAYFMFDIGEAVPDSRVSSMNAVPQKQEFMESFLDSLS